MRDSGASGMCISQECSLNFFPLTHKLPPSPYSSLSQFFAAGTLNIKLAHGTSDCDTHSQSWHSYTQYTQDFGVNAVEDTSVFRLLNFLVEHRFISATCRIGNKADYDGSVNLYIRIYLIPYDLPNVEGRLRRRDGVSVLTPARKYLRALLLRLQRDPASWEGHAKGPFSPLDLPLIPEEIEHQTLAGIYNNLPSPVVSERFKDENPHFIQILEDNIHGMRSHLHTYQRRSVAAMLQKELYPGRAPDPLYITINGMNGEPFYLQPATMEVLRERPSVELNRGGILCEELGTGKTVMILALVLTSIDQLPTPEEAILDVRPVLTPLALKYFPSSDFAEARKRLAGGRGRSNKNGQQHVQHPRIPSLTEYLMHHIRTQPEGFTRHEDVFRARGLWQAFKSNIPFYLHYPENFSGNGGSRSSRKTNSNALGPRKIFISAATLVVVPSNLFNQWTNEINKHCEDGLRIYTAQNPNIALPCAMELASSYDIILMTHPRLSVESQKTNVQKLHSWTPCGCPNPPNSPVRVPNCECNKIIDDVSPLLQIRWKRLLVDEGHVAGTTTTNLMTFIKLMSIERKWIVTGTPTTNLMGLRFGEGTELQYPEEEKLIDEEHSALQDFEQQSPGSMRSLEPESPSDDVKPQLDPFDIFGGLQYPEDAVIDEVQEQVPVPVPTDSSSLFQRTSNFESHDSGDSPQPQRTRVWTRADRDDLHRLDNMISSFLEIPQFSSDPKLFSLNVIAPLMDASGPRMGSIQVLAQVMESVMVRHRIEDVENDVLLPMLTHEMVLLDLDPFAVKTYNIMQATIAMNAVDSERIDQDYFFHPRNAVYLQQLIDNISQSMFWQVDTDDIFGVDDIMKRAPAFLQSGSKKLAEGRITQSDFDLLQEAVKHVESAYKDRIWRCLMTHPFVFHRVYNMPSQVFQAWSNFPFELKAPESTNAPNPEPHFLLVPDRLKTLRNMLNMKPFSSFNSMVEWGKAVSEEEHHRLQLMKLRAKASKASISRKSQEHRKEMSSATKADTAAQFLAAQDRLKSLMSEDQGNNPRGNAKLLRSSPLAGVRIGTSTSSKLNYILNDVRKYAASEKFLIFSRSPMTLVYIAESLGMIGVQYKLIWKKSVRQLEQDVTTFESSDIFRVFLMELKHGARGLNLITASRVIFCEPVWQADVETQAIKRVHRIGQTSPVTVKTLAIRSTAEEVMVARRDALKRSLGSGSGKLPNLTDDRTMRDFIANPTFLPETTTQEAPLDFPFLHIPNDESSAEEDHKLYIRIPASSPAKRPVDALTVSDTEMPAKKQKTRPTVRFDV